MEHHLTEGQLNGPAEMSAIADLSARVGVALPESYLEFLRAHNGGEGFIGDNYIVFWEAEEVIDFNREYEVESYAPGIFLFASDGGGEGFGFDTLDAAMLSALGDVARGLKDVDFQRMDSLYLASRARDVPRLMAEGDARRGIGLDARWLDADALRKRFDVDAGGALLTRQAARVDPYRLTYGLLQRVRQRGGNVHDRTVLHTLAPASRGVSAVTEGGASIHARHVVLAMGYANQHWLEQRVARNRSSYAFITDPIDAEVLGQLQRTMVWESARPYLYLRATGDRRLLVGGLDDAIDIPARRDRRVQRKADKLMKQLLHWFPRLDPVPAFSWAGTFAETADGLPFFGPHAQWGPRVHFAMAYGGNGITYSMIGAQLLRARIERRKHALEGLFGFGRL